MNYYEFLLPNSNAALVRLKRAFLLLATFNFVTGLIGVIIAVIIYWVIAIIPAIWFLLGFVYGNIAYLFVTDYKYVYDNGTLNIFRHRKYGKYRLAVSMAIGDIDWDCIGYSKQKNYTNTTATTKFVYQEVLYSITVDDYMDSLIKGELNVS